MKVTNFRELMHEQANAAVRVSGAHHSSWNGRFGAPIPESSRTGGTANWNHTISYNPRHVDEPLQDMFRNNRVYNQDRADLRRYRDAVRVVLHENTHMLTSEGREHAQAEHAFARQPGVRALEEGVTELYSHQALNEYIDDLGIDQVAPGIKDVRSAMVYPEYTPAVEGLADTVGRKSGMAREEVIARLAVVPADQKFGAAAAAMYDNSRLAGIIPEDQRDHAVAQIAEAMRAGYSQVDKLPASASAEQRYAVGRQAAAEGSKAMSQLRKQWQMPSPSQQVQRSAAPQQQREGQPKRAEETKQSADAGVRAPSPAASPAALPPDVAAAARVGLSGAQPLRTASRLAPDHQGARGTGASPTPAHHRGPETHTSR